MEFSNSEDEQSEVSSEEDDTEKDPDFDPNSIRKMVKGHNSPKSSKKFPADAVVKVSLLSERSADCSAEVGSSIQQNHLPLDCKIIPTEPKTLVKTNATVKKSLLSKRPDDSSENSRTFIPQDFVITTISYVGNFLDISEDKTYSVLENKDHNITAVQTESSCRTDPDFKVPELPELSINFVPYNTVKAAGSTTDTRGKSSDSKDTDAGYKANIDKHQSKRRHPFKCKLCYRKYTSSSNLRLHVAENHRDYMCDTCGNIFNNRSLFLAHCRFHNKGRQHKCDICSAKFSRKNHLTDHLRIHTGERPYICDICGCKVTTRKCLNVHMKRHVGQKAFKCEVCQKSFVTRAEIKKHSVVHSKVKPFQCPICEQRFTQKPSVTRHIRVVHPEHHPAKTAKK